MKTTHQVIAIANQKGGVGKTTTAINLAFALALRGQETLLIDLDPQANATSGLGFDKTPMSSVSSIYPVLMEERRAVEALQPTRTEYLDMIGSSSELIGAEIELVSALARESRLKKAISDIGDLYRFILIDCPPSLGLLSINAIAAANKVILPIQSEYYALEGLASFASALQKIRSAINPGLEIEGVVLTMFDARVSLARQVKAELEKFFKGSSFETSIPRNVRLAEAPSFGQSIFEYDPGSKGAEAYQSLADELLSRRGLKIPTGEKP